MKKIVIKVTIIITILTVIGLCNHYESTYTRDVTVVNVKGEEVTVQDNRQHLWSFFSDSKYKVGEHITVVMNDQHTTSIIEDDTIVGVKKEKS